jgi:hypothetical protein
MNFTHGDLTFGTLFVIFLTQFHPFLSFKYRFDPTISRQDRFLMLFAKITFITFTSFQLFRKLDVEEDGVYVFPKYKVVGPIVCMILFSVVVLPLPYCVSKLFEIKYLLTDLPDNFDDTGHFFGASGDQEE